MKCGVDRFALGVLVSVAAVTASGASAVTLTNEASYVKWKWRTDVSDPSTGLGAEALRREISARLPKWKTEQSWAMAKARAFAFLCDRTAIDVSPFDWFPTFARWTRHTLKLHPLWEELAKRRGEVMSARHPDLWCNSPHWYGYPDFDHSAPYWEDILRLGFPGMAERLKANWKETDYYPPRQVAIDGVLRLIDRFIAQGERGEKGERVRKQVESLKRLKSGAPLTAYDVLNFIYLYWVISENFECIQVRTLGNLDRLLTPYYRADLAAGRTTEAEFRDQLKHFWWQWGSISNYWGQPVFFGGTEADGSSVYNEVSAILLDIHDELALPTPKLHLKVGKSTPAWVWNRAIDMARRMRPISFLGEEPHWRVIRSMGYTEEQAREFIVWGCYEWAIRDSANDTFGAAVNIAKPLELLLADAVTNAFAAADFDVFKSAYLKRVEARTTEARAFAFEVEKELGEINPSLLFSLATRHSVETGKDAYAGGMLHGNNTGVWMIGLGTSVDALLAVKELVYERKEQTLSELGRLMADDWKGREDLRLRMMRSKRKWGNNDSEANALCRELVKVFAAEVNGRPNSRGGRFKAFGHTARWHYSMGHETGATPDGRRAGEELSKNVSPTMGVDTEGATALIDSAAHLDAVDLLGDMPLDVALLPSTVAGEKGIAVMHTLIEQYFANGGLVIQFNVHDAETLRDAQRHPAKYENLQVRVAGWNVRWNDIPKVEQDKFILRQEGIAQ